VLFCAAWVALQNAHFCVQTGQRFETVIRDAKRILDVHRAPAVLLKGHVKIQHHVLFNGEVGHRAKSVRPNWNGMVGVFQPNGVRHAVIARRKPFFAHHLHDLLDDA
jgi:hypothetical protein